MSDVNRLSDEALLTVRERAIAVAYRMLGSRSDADDVAQETLVRAESANRGSPIRNLEAFSTTVATRLALDELRSARRRRESYVGPWLPEPVATHEPIDLSPQGATELADSLSFAFLVVMETLSPPERAAFLLHDTFGYGYPEIAEILGRHEPACRQLVARARRRLVAGGHRREVDRVEQSELTERFVAAARLGDVEGLLAMLAPDAVLVSDGGADRRAARRPIVGRERVAALLRTVGPRVLVAGPIERRELNGEPGFVVCDPNDRVSVAVILEVAAGQITRVNWVSNPAKLRWTGTAGSN
jgi:RNA polymerase sigma-70 factor (ECF subfamily)